jgi:hypothetical protein
VTRLWDRQLRFISQQREVIFLLSKIPSGYQGSFPGIKLLGHKADHSPPFGAKVKNEQSCTSTPSIRLDGMDRDNFTLTFICQYY